MGMTLDEAIKHAEEVAEQNEIQAEKWRKEGGEKWGKTIVCRECAAEHRQLAEWLKDYKRLLEQEPCEDCISRQAVKELYYKDGYIDFRKICELPPVTPQPKAAYWIEESSFWLRCSSCGKHFSQTSTYNFISSNYCPNCGCRMVESQKSEEVDGSD